MFGRAFAVSVACLSAVAANAQHPIVLQKLQTWDRASPPPANQVLQEHLIIAAQPYYDGLASCDLSSANITDIRSATADRFAFSGITRGTLRNAWFLETQLPSCDEAPVRFTVFQMSDGSLQVVRTNRGRSIAWESLISDAMPMAAMGAQAAIKRAGFDCDTTDVQLGIVRIGSEGEDLGPETYGIRYSGGWSEIWPITTCDKTVEVRMDFVADGDGGAYINVPGDKTTILS